MKTTAFWTNILGIGLLCFAASAQDKPPAKKKAGTSAPADMQMPKPGPEMAELRKLVGTWTTEETYEKSPFMPAGGTGTGVDTVRVGPGGFSILLDVRAKSSMGAFTGHGVQSWDPNEKAYKFTWVDSMTPGVILETGHKEGDSLVFKGEMMMMGKKMSVKDVISDRTANSYVLTSYANDGSGEKKVMTIKATRQEATKK